MPYVADAQELAKQAKEDKMLGWARWVTVGGLAVGVLILYLAGCL